MLWDAIHFSPLTEQMSVANELLICFKFQILECIADCDQLRLSKKLQVGSLSYAEDIVEFVAAVMIAFLYR